jgi:hypothetical protein
LFCKQLLKRKPNWQRKCSRSKTVLHTGKFLVLHNQNIPKLCCTSHVDRCLSFDLRILITPLVSSNSSSWTYETYILINSQSYSYIIVSFSSKSLPMFLYELLIA